MGDGFLEKHPIESTVFVLKPASPWSISTGTSPPISGRLPAAASQAVERWVAVPGGFWGVPTPGRAAGQGGLLIVESVIHSCDSQPHPIAVEGSQVWPSAVCILLCEKLFLDVFRLQPLGFFSVPLNSG